MLASEILTYARDTMLGFGIGFLPTDDELLRRLSQESRKLLEELVHIDNMALDLPGDASASIDVSVYAASYAIAAVVWRIRQAEVTYSAGPNKTLVFLPSSWRNTIPQHTPSAYVHGQLLYPLDGGSTRIHGWNLASTVELDYITEPVDLTDGGDTVETPDEALGYLGHFLAHYMAVRGKVAEQTLREIKGARDAEKIRLLGLAKAMPGADQYNVGA